MHARQKVRGSSTTYSTTCITTFENRAQLDKNFPKGFKGEAHKDPKNTNKDPGKMFQSMVWKEKMGNTEEPGREEKI